LARTTVKYRKSPGPLLAGALWFRGVLCHPGAGPGPVAQMQGRRRGL